MNFVDLSYYYNADANDPEALLKNHLPNLGYLNFFPGSVNCSVIKFMNKKAVKVHNSVKYYFFKGSNSKAWLPYTQNKFIQRLHPEIVLTHGLIFPLQIILLKLQLRKQVKILIQHHADQPGRGITKKLQVIADR